MKKFNTFYEEVGNSVNGIAGVRPGDEPPGKAGMSKLVRRKFAGVEMFEVSSNVYYKCILGKKRYARYNEYVGDDDVGQSIREYGRKNPKASIILKNVDTGDMIYFKKRN